MSLEELKNLDVTYSMKKTAEAIEEQIARLSDGCSPQDKETLTVINQKLREVEEEFDRPLDAPEVFVKLKEIAKNAGNSDLENYCQEQVNMLEANDLHFKGYTWLYFGNCVKATEYLGKAAEIAPEHPLAQLDHDKAKKRLDKAEDELAKAEAQIEKDSEKAAAWLKKANALVTMGRTEEALPVFDKVIELDPENDSAMAKKGAALQGLGKHSEAVRMFRAALEFKPKSQIGKKGMNLAEFLDEHPEFEL